MHKLLKALRGKFRLGHSDGQRDALWLAYAEGFSHEEIAGITGLGAYGSGSHAPGETIDLASQTYQTQRVALFLYGLTR